MTRAGGDGCPQRSSRILCNWDRCRSSDRLLLQTTREVVAYPAGQRPWGIIPSGSSLYSAPG
jgi:hypothetical protein